MRQHAAKARGRVPSAVRSRGFGYYTAATAERALAASAAAAAPVDAPFAGAGALIPRCTRRSAATTRGRRRARARALREQSGLGVGVEGLHALKSRSVFRLDEVLGGRARRTRRRPQNLELLAVRRRLDDDGGLHSRSRARPRPSSRSQRDGALVPLLTCALSRFREDGGASGWRKWCCAKRCSRRPQLVKGPPRRGVGAGQGTVARARISVDASASTSVRSRRRRRAGAGGPATQGARRGPPLH